VKAKQVIELYLRIPLSFARICVWVTQHEEGILLSSAFFVHTH